MSTIVKLCILLNLSYILIECLMPGRPPKLSVRKLDKKLIDRKRQDTLDMCRIFTEETEKLAKQKQFKKYNIISPKKTYSRVKRSLQDINPALKGEDVQRVENIVDKMYDDMLDRGEKVNYRREYTSFKIDTPSNMSGRRFFFAPQFLEGPIATSAPDQDKHILPSADGKKLTLRFKHGVLPYFIDTAYYDTQLVEIIINAFDYFEKVTCIRLQRLRERPIDSESLLKVEWLHITNPTGIRQCVHSNEQAYHEGVQNIVFGYDCMTLGDIVHELMHVLGFPHEHNRPDRDRYITILWDNIKTGYKKYFELNKNTGAENMPYDYASVMHYPSRAFSRNGQITIMTQPGIKIGQREGLSELDFQKINSLYSAECVKRNREYLLTTCPSVVQTRDHNNNDNITLKDIEEYYEPKIWPYGIVNYKINKDVHFSEEELENINAVISHIERETCIEFRNLDYAKDDEQPNEVQLNKNRTVIKDKENNAKVDKQNNTYSKGNNIATRDNIDQTRTVKESLKLYENEIKTDEAHVKGDGNESEQQSSPDEVSLRGHKKFLRQKRSLRTEVNRTQALKAIGLKSKMRKYKNKIYPISPARRHATNVIVFKRSALPGCPCPKTPAEPNNIVIHNDCFNTVNDLLHLFVHILGLGHQHNSHDRDSYLHINWNELTDDVKDDVTNKLPPAASAGFPYDYQSVMHFPWLHIKNGRTSIMYPIWNDGWAMGHWQGLSSMDVLKLNKIYYKQCTLRGKAVREALSKNYQSEARKGRMRNGRRN